MPDDVIQTPPTRPLLVRDASTEDAPLLVAIVQASFEEYRGLLHPPSGAHKVTPESVGEMLLGGSQALIAAVEGTPAGCLFTDSEGDFLYVHRLAVLPEFRRLGLGREMMSAVETRARESGFTGLRLATRIVLERNHRFYERLGFHKARLGENLWEGQPFYVIFEKLL